MTVTLKDRAEAIAILTANAVSAEAYYSWPAVCEKLLRRGYSDEEVMTIVKSKYTRWARNYADDVRKSTRWGRYSAKDVIRYLKKSSGNRIKKEREMIAKLMEE